MFHLAVVLESGDVVGGGLQAQDEAEFVIDLDRGFAETMPDAGPLDPRCELTADLLGELGSDPVADAVLKPTTSRTWRISNRKCWARSSRIRGRLPPESAP